MLLKVLKSNQPYHFLMIPIIALALWISSLMKPTIFPFYPGEDMMILYQPINYLLGENLLANNMVALIFMILLAFLILKREWQKVWFRNKY